MKKKIDAPTFISVPEAARLCGVSRNTVFTWVKKGQLKAYQTPGHTNRIRPADLTQFMNANGMFVPNDLSELAQRDEKATAVPAHEPEEGGPKVLIVDDEPAIRSLVARSLRDMCTIYQAETGYEAQHLLTKHTDIRAMILDLRMPGQHGLATLHEVRARHPNVKVIIVTGYDAEIPQGLLEDGMFEALLRKPFGITELKETITKLLASPKR
jgi:excisionase family DNA binding protein